MIGFKLNNDGDVAIENGKIAMISGADLIAQTVKCVLSTNKGEWIFNKDEGISFEKILGKGTKLKKSTEKAEAEGLTYTEEMILAERLRNRLNGGD